MNRNGCRDFVRHRQLGLWKFIERNEIEQFKDLIIKQIYLRNDVNYNRQDILKKSISKSTMKSGGGGGFRDATEFF
ncbi:hypothetical protein RCL_jg29223.t1 [Rhizophagus clarus]|uniref:Uncharacterized protein n=1 Tax=Rhizophagus clarus TaxID=94130 RepID=A0A8H3MAZ8_9GLOM|nr:hypothetical protein RCL_jg29223.t1 [Rhizophagus clarus]